MTEQKRRDGGGRKPLEGQVMSQDVGQRDMSRLGGLWKRSERGVSLHHRNTIQGVFLHKYQRKDSNSRA